MIDIRQRDILQRLWEKSRLSRWELHELTGYTPNNVGTLAESLITMGVIREGPTEPTGAGRPRVPLEIDPTRRHVAGVAIAPGHIEVGRVGLKGHPMGSSISKNLDDASKVISTAASQLKKTITDETIAIGLSITGFVDAAEHTVLFSSAFPGKGHASLAPIYEAAGDLPVVLENDMHAMAARWLLTHRAAGQDVLLVLVEDGRLGAAMLIDGRPNRGCATGGNELGHSRFLIDTDPCYCGHTGCLERIVSTDFYKRQLASNPAGNLIADEALFGAAAKFTGDFSQQPALETIVNYLACGLANAVNFVRPHRLVLVSSLTRFSAFNDALVRKLRGYVLMELADRVKIDFWDEPAAGSAETAAWLGLADLFFGGWGAEVAKAK